MSQFFLSRFRQEFDKNFPLNCHNLSYNSNSIFNGVIIWVVFDLSQFLDF